MSVRYWVVYFVKAYHNPHTDPPLSFGGWTLVAARTGAEALVIATKKVRQTVDPRIVWDEGAEDPRALAPSRTWATRTSTGRSASPTWSPRNSTPDT